MRADKDPLPELIAALRAKQLQHRLTALRSLGRLGPLAADALQAVQACLYDPEATIREAAAQALGQMGPIAIPHLRAALSHPDRHVRRHAVWALGKMGAVAHAAVPELCRALSDTDQRTCTGAAQALGEIGPAAAAAIPALIEALKGTNMVLCRLAAKALSRIGPRSVPALLEALMSPDSFVRGEAALALGWLGADAEEAVCALAELLRVEPGQAPAKPSGPGGGPGAGGQDALVTRATLIVPHTDTGDLVRVYAAQALGRIGPVARLALPALTAALRDPSERVREAAAAAIAQIQPKP
jgi:HEAT repeat protein